MPQVTYYVALPFTRTDEGELVAGEAEERQTASAAVSAAANLARTHAGAVAFSRTGDPAIGEFTDAVVIKSFGDVLSLEEMLSSG